MFGYVRVLTDELKVREWSYYKAVYCGLCHTLGHCTGQCSRMTLSYDFAYLVAIRMALTNTRPTFKNKRCFPHPLKKRLIVNMNPELEWCADATAILTGLKWLDDLQDEKGFKKLKVLLTWPFVKVGFKRASKRHPGIVSDCSNLMSRLSQMEKDNCPSLDEHAEICGEMLALLFSYQLKEKKQIILANQLGKELGRLIDMLDAVDDWEKDKKRGCYNPLLSMYPGREIRDELFLTDIRTALQGELLKLQRAVDLMDFDGRENLESIVKNVVYLSMPHQIESILQKYKSSSALDNLQTSKS